VYAPLDSDKRPPDIPLEVSFSVSKLDDEIEGECRSMSTAIGWAAATHGASQELLNTIDFEREQTQRYWQHGIMASWSFGERGLYLRRFSEGECVASQGALQNLPVVLGDAVSWDQILEFRCDYAARGPIVIETGSLVC
jgi:hypothetical protein